MTSPGKYTHRVSATGGYYWLARVSGQEIYFGQLCTREGVSIEPAGSSFMIGGDTTVEDFYKGGKGLMVEKLNTFKGNK